MSLLLEITNVTIHNISSLCCSALDHVLQPEVTQQHKMYIVKIDLASEFNLKAATCLYLTVKGKGCTSTVQCNVSVNEASYWCCWMVCFFTFGGGLTPPHNSSLCVKLGYSWLDDRTVV